MGAKIHCESYLPEFNSMRDLNDDSSSSRWPFYHGEKNRSNGQYHNGFMPRSLVDGYPWHEKDALKQKMLEHEAVFKNQVCELHRLYRIQRDMMEEAKRKEPSKSRASMEPASSSNLHHPQVPLNEARKWHFAGFPLLNPGHGGTLIPGAEIVNSPTSCLRTNPTQSNRLASKESEDLRPLKVRKKLFDLRLPADEYIDIQEGENPKECQESHVSGYNVPNRAPKSGPESSMKLFIGGSSVLKCSNGLANLNEPIQIDDDDGGDVGPSSVDFLGRAGIIEAQGIDHLAKSTAGYLGDTGNAGNGFSLSSSFESKANTRGHLSHTCEAGSSRGNYYYSPAHIRHPDKSFLPSHPVRDLLDRAQHPSSYYNREVVWRDGPRQTLESSNRNHGSHFPTSWARPIPHWANPTSSTAQNSPALETGPKSLFLLRNNEPALNRSYNTTTLGTKEVRIHPPLTGFDYLNVAVSDCSTNHHGSGILPTVPRGLGPKPAIDINLSPHDTNVESKPEEHHLGSLPWLKPKPVTDSKITNLPSVKAEIQTRDEIPETRAVQKILGIPIFEKSSPKHNHSSIALASASVDPRVEVKNILNERKNGLFDINVACEPDEDIASDELIPISEKETSRKGDFIVHRAIDLNSCLSDCEEYPAPIHEQKSTSVKITLEIDLEVPVFLENEDDKQENESHSQRSQYTENGPEKDDILQDAAQTIFSISSSGPQNGTRPEVSLSEAINWFVDAISSSPNETSRPKNCLPKDEIDEFEAMILELAETKEEDYMPKPFVLEISKTEEEKEPNGSTMVRPRRGQTRRGRPRKDFQRDILPGLTTLSRHEVTEDLQIFGGLMRATGHSWNFGPTRRNGGARGRRRAATVAVETSNMGCGPTVGGSGCPNLFMKQIGNNNSNNVNRALEGGLEERRLSGWGKTTRRPRRQRCPAGNISTVVLM